LLNSEPQTMSIASAARRVAKLLAMRQCKVVFAESCSGGLVSGALTAVPGISQYHCGGVVVYRNATKTAYLGISPRTLKKPGPVSPPVARQMAEQVLMKTPEADVAVSVTGHLGPDAPPQLDGHVYVGVSQRGEPGHEPTSQTHFLSCQAKRGRRARQRWVVEQVLGLLAKSLEREGSNKTKETD
jgi:nicotinamide-nucleotide amidase